MRVESAELIGRKPELGLIESALDRVESGASSFVLEAGTGMGKTTLWEAAIVAAERRGMTVIRCAPTEAESTLPFVGLLDLVGGVADEVELADPQREALDVALRRAQGDATGDRLAVALAVLEIMRATARARPTLVAVDDAQWLDAPTARALDFALRRLDRERVLLMAATRPSPSSSLLTALDEERTTVIALEPLTADETAALLRSRIDLHISRPLLTRIHNAARGNPLYALELGRGVAAAGSIDDETLPVPPGLTQLVEHRLRSLSVAAQDSLLPMAALGQPSVSIMQRFSADAGGALDEAIAADVIQRDADRLSFVHPLFASVVYAQAPLNRRRSVHRRLAELVTNPQECAHHLARGANAPDANVAALLESAAERAAQSGAPDTAMELVEHARRLTPRAEAEAAARRRLAAASYAWVAGDAARSREIAEGLIASSPPGAWRVRARLLLARILDDIPLTISHLERALEEAAGDDALQAATQSTLARQRLWSGDASGALREAEAAAVIAEAAGAESELAVALGWAGAAQVLGGRPVPEELFDHALSLEAKVGSQIAVGDSPTRNRGVAAIYTDDLARAEACFAAADARAVTRSESWRAIILMHVSEVRLRRGDVAGAETAVREAEEIARQWSLGHAEAAVLAHSALVNAHLGRADEARAAAAAAIDVTRAGGYEVVVRRAERALGFLELSRGDAAAADAALRPLLMRAGLGDPWARAAAADAIEAAVMLGDLDRGEMLTVELAATQLARADVVLRSRALLSGARKDLDSAAAEAEEAVDAAPKDEPFEVARALLVQGVVERRRKQKTAAREALSRALELFEVVGAPLWRDRAVAELGRTGLRQAEPGALTPTEQQVAELAAKGVRNKQIAETLFVSVKTVEANLSRIYGKLNVRSRTELARRI